MTDQLKSQLDRFGRKTSPADHTNETKQAIVSKIGWVGISSLIHAGVLNLTLQISQPRLEITVLRPEEPQQFTASGRRQTFS